MPAPAEEKEDKERQGLLALPFLIREKIIVRQ